MYLYFDNQGNKTTEIFHGAPPRQGNDMCLFICFEENFFISNEEKDKYAVQIRFAKPGEGTSSVIMPMYEVELLKFEKNTSYEVTYDLVSGKYYWTYQFYLSKEYFENFGRATISTEILYGNAEEKSVKYIASSDIFIEKTFGYNKSMTIDDFDYKELKNIADALNLRISNIESSRRVFRANYLPNNANLQNGDIFILDGGYKKAFEITDLEKDLLTENYTDKVVYFTENPLVLPSGQILIKNRYYIFNVLKNKFEKIKNFSEKMGNIYKYNAISKEFILINSGINNQVSVLPGNPGTGSKEVYVYDTIDDFPIVGMKNSVYISSGDQKSYVWVSENIGSYYKSINDYEEIEIIDGGLANGK